MNVENFLFDKYELSVYQTPVNRDFFILLKLVSKRPIGSLSVQFYYDILYSSNGTALNNDFNQLQYVSIDHPHVFIPFRVINKDVFTPGTVVHFYYSISGDSASSYRVPAGQPVKVTVVAAASDTNPDAVISNNAANANSFNSYLLDVTCAQLGEFYYQVVLSLYEGKCQLTQDKIRDVVSRGL